VVTADLLKRAICLPLDTGKTFLLEALGQAAGETGRRVPGSFYECPDCETRHLNQRRCPDCQLFCRRIDTGGYCPHCDEPVAITELAQPPHPGGDP
jgi:hypothetical protein